MQKTYLFNYIKIYVWQALAIVLNLLSMFIVVPRISHIPSIYGVYSLCLAVSIFLIYADFGFIGAGSKFASESFARNDLPEEIKIVGFSGFILFVFVILYSVLLFFLSLHPLILIKNNVSPLELKIAGQLLAILAFTCWGILLQRFMQIVYGIRLEDYIFQRILIGSNLLKIISVVYFFRGNKYDIIGYFLFCQIMNLAAGVVALVVAKNRYSYDMDLLLRSFKFSKKVFAKTKNIAFGSLFSTGMAILYYELDPFVIMKLFGADKVALYAIGLTLLSYFRAIFGMIYGPFAARFNHFVGVKDELGLSNICKRAVIFTAPIVIFPILVTILLMKPFVYSWVGGNYDLSIIVSQLLIASFIYSFLAYPASIMIIAKEKIRILYVVNAILPVIYWAGIALTVSSLGIVSFSLFKLVSFTIMAIVYLLLLKQFLKTTVTAILSEVLYPAIVPLIFLLGASWGAVRILPCVKNNFNFVSTLISIGIISFLSIVLYILFSKQLREFMSSLYAKFKANQRVLAS